MNLQNLHSEHKDLTSAVAQLVENSLQFSDVAIDAIQNAHHEDLRANLKLFISKTLAIAQKTLAADDEEKKSGASVFQMEEEQESEIVVDEKRTMQCHSADELPVGGHT
jgi:hypothetical protein